MTTAERFKAARVSRGLTQLEVAEILGINKSMIAQIEGGFSRPTLDKLRDYADTLGWDRRELSEDLAERPQPGPLARSG